MSEDVKHLHVRNPLKPCYTISIKGILKILEDEGGIIHIYAPRTTFRLNKLLSKENKSFIKKRLGREHWVYCLKEDTKAKEYVDQMLPYESTRFDANQAVQELIDQKVICIPAERAPSVSKAYYNSDFFKRTQKSILVKNSTTREFMDISLQG